jgi:hypothetical protein
MRVRHHATFTNRHPAGSDNPRSGDVSGHADATPRTVLSRTSGALAVLAIAASIAFTAARLPRYPRPDASSPARNQTRSDPREASLTSPESQDCPARYAALLDLAELARRDGRAADVVMRGLSDGRGALNGCLLPLRVQARLQARVQVSQKQNAPLRAITPLTQRPTTPQPTPAIRSTRIP